MRIYATFSSADDSGGGLAELKRIFSESALLEVEDPVESRNVMGQLVADMVEADRHRFQRTVRHIAQDPRHGTVASISELKNNFYVVRLRNVTLRKLVPGGHALINSIMSQHGPHGSGMFKLQSCEVRELGQGEGFLFARWVGGERSYFKFLRAQRRANFIMMLFLVGLLLEISLTFMDQSLSWVQLGLRLGAPLLVSSLVLLLERRAQWRDQLEPALRWSTDQGENMVDLSGSFTGH